MANSMTSKGLYHNQWTTLQNEHYWCIPKVCFPARRYGNPTRNPSQRLRASRRSSIVGRKSLPARILLDDREGGRRQAGWACTDASITPDNHMFLLKNCEQYQ